MDPQHPKENPTTDGNNTTKADNQKQNQMTQTEVNNQKSTKEQNVYEIKPDTEGTITKAELTLTNNRDPVFPNQTKQEHKLENQSQINKGEQKTIKQISIQQIKMTQNIGIASQRPISINIGKDFMQIEKHEPVFKEPEIKIEIKESFQKGFALNKQIFYQITGFDKHGPINIHRSQTEFQSLRRILLQRWPGCFIPNVLIRSEIKTDAVRNQYRRKNLQNFLKKISYTQQVYYKQQIQLFLRCHGVNTQQMFTEMPVLKVKDVIERFKVCFGENVQKSITPEGSSSIIRFSTSLKKIANNLNNLSKRFLKLAESYQVYQQTIPKFSKFLSNYQQICLSQYITNPNDAIILKDSQQKTAKLGSLSQKKNVFYDLYFLLQSQLKDAQSLSEIILAMQMFNVRREQIEAQSKQIRMQIEQISLGQSNFKVMTSRKPKQVVQSELEERQKFLISEKHTIVQLQQISEVILSNFTIPMFKSMKISHYQNLIRDWIDIVGDTNAEIFQVWKFLLEEGKENLKKSKSH